MNLEVHILTSDYSWVLPWTLRHYCSFADRVIVHDGGPSWDEEGTTRKLCACHGAIWRQWDTAGELNDDLAVKLKNSCWRDTDAAWVIVADDDELIWFPEPAMVDGRRFVEHAAVARHVLSVYENLGAAVIKPHGFEMFSDTLPVLGEHNQIWGAIRDGAPDDKWYAKPVLFSARRVADSGFGLGAHEARVVTKDGYALVVDKDWPRANPPAYLLHYHQIGPEAFVAERYDATFRRFSQKNLAHGWGNHTPGAIHVREKRSAIMPNLRRVVE